MHRQRAYLNGLIGCALILFSPTYVTCQWIIPQPRHPVTPSSDTSGGYTPNHRPEQCTEGAACPSGTATTTFLEDLLPFLTEDGAKSFFGQDQDGLLTNASVLAHKTGAAAYVEYASYYRGPFRLGIGVSVASEQRKSGSDTLPPDKALFNRFQSGGGTFTATLAFPLMLVPNGHGEPPLFQVRGVSLLRAAADLKDVAVGAIIQNPRAMSMGGANVSVVMDLHGGGIAGDFDYGWAVATDDYRSALGLASKKKVFTSGFLVSEPLDWVVQAWLLQASLFGLAQVPA